MPESASVIEAEPAATTNAGSARDASTRPVAAEHSIEGVIIVVKAVDVGALECLLERAASASLMVWRRREEDVRKLDQRLRFAAFATVDDLKNAPW